MSKMIEFAGMPNAGKTSVIDMVDRQLRREGYSVYSCPEGANLIRNGRNLGSLYDIRILLHSLSILIDNIQHTNFDVVLFDRAVFDTIGWLNYRLHKNEDVVKITKMKEFVLLMADYISLCVFLTCDAHTAIERDKRSSITIMGNGVSNNVVFLQDLAIAYEETLKELSGYPQIIRVDTTQIHAISTARIVYNSIVGTIQ